MVIVRGRAAHTCCCLTGRVAMGHSWCSLVTSRPPLASLAEHLEEKHLAATLCMPVYAYSSLVVWSC